MIYKINKDLFTPERPNVVISVQMAIQNLLYAGYNTKCTILNNDVTVTIWNDAKEEFKVIYRYNVLKAEIKKKRSNFMFKMIDGYLDRLITSKAIVKTIKALDDIKGGDWSRKDF